MSKPYYYNKGLSLSENDTINMYLAFGDLEGFKRDYPKLYEKYMREVARMRDLENNRTD